MKILILNGPNINLVGIREKGIYGNESYQDILALCKQSAKNLDIEIEFFQSNHEGELVDRIQKTLSDGVEGIVFNPAAYTHTSIALLDALKAVSKPCVEVHISDVSSRENYRQVSYIREACFKTISGLGILGYQEAIIALKKKLGGLL